VGLILSQICLRKVQWWEREKFLEFVLYPQVNVIFFCFSDLLCSVVALEESPCIRGASTTNFQVNVLVLVLESQVTVLVIGCQSVRKFPYSEFWKQSVVYDHVT